MYNCTCVCLVIAPCVFKLCRGSLFMQIHEGQFACLMAVVLDDVVCLGDCSGDDLCRLYHSLQWFAAVSRTVLAPDWDAARQRALDGSPVEVCEDAGVRAKYPCSPKKKEQLSSFLDRGVCLKCPGEALYDVHAEEPEAADPLNFSIADLDVGGVHLPAVLHNHLLGFADIEKRGCLPCTSSSVPSPLLCGPSRRCFMKRPSLVVSSVNLVMMVLWTLSH